MLIIDDFLTVGHRRDVDLDEAMIAVVVDHSVELLLHDLDRSDRSIHATPIDATRIATGDETPVVN